MNATTASRSHGAGVPRVCSGGRRGRLGRRLRLVGCAAATLIGAVGLTQGASSAANREARSSVSSLSGTITAEFDAGLTFDSNAVGVTWWNHVAAEFHSAYPHATLNLDNVSGDLSAYTTKLALQFRNPAAAPDVFQINSQYLGEFASGGDLLALNQYVNSGQIPGWSFYPANVKGDDTFGGKIYGVDEGENIGAILYNKVLLKKAGISMPWSPKTWAQIIKAAQAVKVHDPSVYPLGIAAGTATAAGGIAQGTGNLIYGSSTATIYDSAHGRWVVGSSGLTQVLGFYRTVFADGLGVPVSYLFASNAIGEIPTLMSQGKIAIAVVGSGAT